MPDKGVPGAPGATTPISERRCFQRILFDAPVKLDYQSISRTTCLIDISLKGALVKAPEDWQLSIGCRLDLSVALNGADSAIHMQAQVAHIEPGQIGLLCDGIDMQSITHLRRLVELNLGDNALLERDLQALG